MLLAALVSVAADPASAQAPGDGAAPAAASTGIPAWAYPWNPAFSGHAPDAVLHHLPGSTAAFSTNHAADLFFSPDWHPDAHPPMPEVVAHGRKPDVRACGSCHRAEGTGGPENASLAGLPADYIVQQIADFRSGARASSDPQRVPVLLMIETAKGLSDADAWAAARYFSALKPKPNIEVVETDTVPKTRLMRAHFVVADGDEKEPIGARIVEVPVNAEQFALRDSGARFIAWVPSGSLAKGKALVESGGSGTTVACAGCHGAGLHGTGAIPGIVGRSPSYIVRQLHDFKHGARAGAGAALMKPTVEKLSAEDIRSIAAYLASVEP